MISARLSHTLLNLMHMTNAFIAPILLGSCCVSETVVHNTLLTLKRISNCDFREARDLFNAPPNALFHLQTVMQYTDII